MTSVVFVCPKTGLRVQAKLEDYPSDGAGEGYQAVKCIACKGMHWINLKTGQTLNRDEKQQ
jgi:hypothetical protein